MSSPPDGAGRLKRLLYRIGQFQSAVLLTVFYFLLWVPVGLLSQVLADWLRKRAPERSNWQARAERINLPESLREPF